MKGRTRHSFRDALWRMLNDHETIGYKVFAIFIAFLILLSTAILTLSLIHI